MQRRTLLRHVGAGALSIGVVHGVTGTALAGGFDVSFHVDDRSVGDDDEHVDVDCGTPTTVEGRIVGDESCFTADLVDYGWEDGDLQFRIETVEDASDCTDHHVAIEYTIRASDLDDRPAGVCVYHDGDRVTRVDCSSDDTADHAADDDPSEFEFDDEDPPEFDFDVDEDPPEFDFDVDDDPPEFDFDVDDDPPEFDFDVDEVPPEFSFPD